MLGAHRQTSLARRAPEILLPTADGGLFNSTASLGTPAVFNIYDPASGFSSCLWECDVSIDELILRGASKGSEAGATPVSDFIFLSYSSTAAADVAALAYRFDERLAALGIVGEQALEEWHAHLHFAITPAADVPTIAPIVASWPTTTDHIFLDSPLNSSVLTLPRLDPRYDWIGWNYDPSAALHNASTPLALLGDGCSDEAPPDLTVSLAAGSSNLTLLGPCSLPIDPRSSPAATGPRRCRLERHLLCEPAAGLLLL